jgi:MFS family permease
VAAVGAATMLSFAILAEHFPKQLAGRANGALNLFHIAAAFVVQYATGVVLQYWTPQAGHYPESLIRRPSLSTSRFRPWHGFGSCFRESEPIREKGSRQNRVGDLDEPARPQRRGQ